jgi:GNAT superfamily N-acetyltransferase
MNIRKATLKDQGAIKNLLDQLEYPGTEHFLPQKIEALLNHPDSVLLVYELDEKVLAVMTIFFIPQLALSGDFARISYFAVDRDARSKGIGKEMEEYCTRLALERNCDRIEVHCHQRRTAAHRFYQRQGYVDSPKYLMKLFRS